ncbi:MAG: hypothetical protein AAFV43_17445, partial [Planctomycetota bacterium]
MKSWAAAASAGRPRDVGASLEILDFTAHDEDETTWTTARRRRPGEFPGSSCASALLSNFAGLRGADGNDDDDLDADVADDERTASTTTASSPSTSPTTVDFPFGAGLVFFSHATTPSRVADLYYMKGRAGL